jgi:hypothetical protein
MMKMIVGLTNTLNNFIKEQDLRWKEQREFNKKQERFNKKLVKLNNLKI